MSDQDPTSSAEPRRGLVGRVFGDRYRVTRIASAGASTVIADADDLQLDRRVTMKFVRPEWAESAEFRRRFVRTMEAVSTLSHPNLVAVYDWGEEQIGRRATTYTVVERLEGGSLRDLFDRGRLLDPSQALVIGLEACRGLDFAHRQGLVHSELTPSKLVFGDDRRLRIVDFGLARLLGAPDWHNPSNLSTHIARYASPEQALAQPIDAKSDVYSLAVILVEAVTGSVPFSGQSTVATLSARVGRLMPVSADLGPLASVLERAGRPDASERSTAAELGRGLVEVANKLPRPAPIPIVVTSVFDDDPSRLRRPNDPTGGVHRPADAPSAPLVFPDPDPDDPFPAERVADPPDRPSGGLGDSSTATSMSMALSGTAVALLEPPGEPDDTAQELAVLAQLLTQTATQPASTPVGDLPPLVVDDGPQRRRRRVWPWLLALFVIGALAALVFLASRLFRTPTHEVPALVGLTEADAAQQTSPFDWEIDVELMRSDEAPDAGQIIRTAPVAGVQLAEGEPFLIVVSEGPELRALPDLTGRSLSGAETELAELRLVALPPTEEFDEEVPVGGVVSWAVLADGSLIAGDEVLPETEVALVISMGPERRVVPQLVGLAVGDATAQLETRRLTVTLGEPVYSDTVPVGGVIAVEPAAGTSIERGATVVITPSLGLDLVALPDLTDQTLPQIQASLLGVGLNIGSLLGDRDGVFVSASVNGEDVEHGNQFERGTAIDLILL